MRRRGSVLDAARRWTASARRRRVGVVCARACGPVDRAVVGVPRGEGVSVCTLRVSRAGEGLGADVAPGKGLLGVRPAAVAVRPAAVVLDTKLVTAPTYGRAAA